jgi:hypothetical protein
MKRMTVQEMQKLVWNKRELYAALSVKGQYFLMPYRHCTFQFLKGVLNKTKLVFRNDQVIHPTVPQYPEFAVGNLIKVAMRCRIAKEYLPDIDDLDPKRLTRAYMCAILGTVDPSFF